MTVKKKVYTFKRGEKYFYDQILFIQALGSGKWWEKYPLGDLHSDDVIITRDITITIIVEGDEETEANA